jgi:hypothetical protein
MECCITVLSWFCAGLLLYNGDARWTAPERLQALVAQPSNGLQRYLPQLEYLLLDEGVIVANGLPSPHNLAALLQLHYPM